MRADELAPEAQVGHDEAAGLVAEDPVHPGDGQLIPKYTTAPESSGFGIFLVPWFDLGKTRCHPAAGGPGLPTRCARVSRRNCPHPIFIVRPEP